MLDYVYYVCNLRSKIFNYANASLCGNCGTDNTLSAVVPGPSVLIIDFHSLENYLSVNFKT